MRVNADDETATLRARVRDLEAVLGQNHEGITATFRLPPVLSNLFGLLLSLPNVTSEMIRQRLEIATDAKVAIHRLRTHLKDFDIEIQSRRNVGYWFDDATKVRIRALIAPATTALAADAAIVTPVEENTQQVA
jgi:hypothetical protein